MLCSSSSCNFKWRYTYPKVGENPWKLAHPLRGSWIHKHSELIGQVSHQTEPGVLPTQSPIMVPVSSPQLHTRQGDTRLWASSGVLVSKRLCFGSQMLYPFSFFIHFLCRRLFSLSLWIPHSSALLDFRVWLWKRSFIESQNQVWHVLWHTGQEQKCILGTIPKLPSFYEAVRNHSNGLAVGRELWMAVWFMTLNLFLLQLLVSWVTPPSLSHSRCAVSFCNSFPYISLHAPHHFYHCEMLWHIGSEEKSV